MAPRLSAQAFSLIQKATPPIYILFFVFVGAGLQINGLKGMGIALVIAYVLFRSIGKMGGTWIGARMSKSPKVVQNLLGYCLFAQGGVAVGLSIMASHKLAGSPEIAQLVVLVVTATTLCVQLLGPVAVRHAVRKAGEVGLNITEEDLIAKYHVSDVMVNEPITIDAGLTLDEVLKVFCSHDYLFYPVVDNSGKVIGSMTIDSVKEAVKYQETAQWLLAYDVMMPLRDHILPDMPLEDAIRHFKAYNLEYCCVVQQGTDALMGLFDLRRANITLTAEVVKCRELSEQNG